MVYVCYTDTKHEKNQLNNNFELVKNICCFRYSGKTTKIWLKITVLFFEFYSNWLKWNASNGLRTFFSNSFMYAKLFMHAKLGSRKIPPEKIPTWKIPTHQTPPWKIPPRKISTQKILTWNIHTQFINCLSSLFLHLILRP